jgi:plastocyanin
MIDAVGSSRGLLLGLVAAAGLAVVPVAAVGKPLAAVTRVTVVVSDTGLRLSSARVPVGRVEFHVRNAGKRPHDFEIAGRRTTALRPGRRATLSIRFAKPGRFGYSSGSLNGVLRVERVTTVDVSEFEFGFRLSQDTVRAGKVVFRMRNDGAILHNFDLIDVEVGPFLVSGQSATMTVNLKPGTYTYVCSVKYHAAQGMQGTLTVT